MNKSFIISGFFLLILLGCSKPITVDFYVEGACEACKTVIEEKVKELDGVVTSDWDFETSLLTVAFEPGKVNEDYLQQFIANQGFETQFFPADPTARKSLPACCQESISRKLKRKELELPVH